MKKLLNMGMIVALATLATAARADEHNRPDERKLFQFDFLCEFNEHHSGMANATPSTPANPADGTSKALINSRYWDPLQRAGSL